MTQSFCQPYFAFAAFIANQPNYSIYALSEN